MNDWKLSIDNLEDIAKKSKDPDLSLAERCALYSAARIILADIEKHILDTLGQRHFYASEKIGKAKWHIGAMLGFDVDNGHDASQHLSWAYSALQTLETLIREMPSQD